jgi:hypothetical protein
MFLVLLVGSETYGEEVAKVTDKAGAVRRQGGDHLVESGIE